MGHVSSVSPEGLTELQSRVPGLPKKNPGQVCFYLVLILYMVK